VGKHIKAETDIDDKINRQVAHFNLLTCRLNIAGPITKPACHMEAQDILCRSPATTHPLNHILSLQVLSVSSLLSL